MQGLNEFLKNVAVSIRVMLFYWENFSFCYIGSLKIEKEENLFKKIIP
jgi:hypothetical protein